MGTNETAKKGARGGARKGAGRKPREHGRAYTFWSTPEVEAVLESVKAKTSFLNEAVMLLAKEKGML